MTNDEKIFTRANVENASYGLSVCAERIAIFKAVSEGYKNFKAIAIYTKDGGFPCGACLQVLSEFVEDKFTVIIAKNENDYKIYKFSEFSPHPFKLKKD